MSPRTRLIPLGVLVLLAGCGEPPRQLPESPPYVTPSAPPISLAPSLPLVTQPLPPLNSNLGTYPSYPVPTTTTATTVPATPTPSHASLCPGPPTKAQIITLIRGKPGIPDAPLKVTDGPYCSGDWSFSQVVLSDETADEDEALLVVSTGKGATLALVEAGSEVCTPQVERDAPPGIRVLACGA
ncbi:hypothetical protein [Paractinoplanes rishiriensis]|uniref:Uncharacterized protein n=1 Tax=Paractinoplanes rishiriensis TaxID=1050105 RepID=A0A919MV73_9ACTN|nr:hypothetical protein [Actinoplanes rishiriensis]GIE96518.1 hypothetical protein Ari01nite_39830 [Actinoplanes rishiriensis]